MTYRLFQTSSLSKNITEDRSSKCYIETDYVELEGLPDRLDIIGFYKA